MLFTVIAIAFFFIAIVISQFITDPNLKIAFWLMLVLIFVSYANIYLSTHFYTKLREQPGLQGERGKSGIRGPQGSHGVCIVQEKCGAVEKQLKALFQDEIKKKNESYRKLMIKVNNGILLNDEEKNIKNMIEHYINEMKELAIEKNWDLETIKKNIDDHLNGIYIEPTTTEYKNNSKPNLKQ